jgi:hypothetical protein
MAATATTVSTRSSINRTLVFATGALMAFVLAAALALAATGWFAEAVRSGPVFDSINALQEHVLREYGAVPAAAPAPAIDGLIYEQVLRENRAR